MYYLTKDLETTGINVLTDEPVQVGWYVTSYEGRVLEEQVILINTDVPISKEAEKVHGISRDKLLLEGRRCQSVAEAYTSLVWKYQPLTILGYNFIGFDFPMWQNFMARHAPGRFKFPPVYSIVDVMHKGSQFLNTRKWPKLSALAKTLNIPVEEGILHDALEDVKLTWKCYKKMRERKIL